jgi:hypothetical protein
LIEDSISLRRRVIEPDFREEAEVCAMELIGKRELREEKFGRNRSFLSEARTGSAKV